mgnify:CR=1 FL=1|tara:strand:+ start:1012 stop:1659 length:648 start_codon:yes stop_codon:yes gene_type:complete
MNLQKTKNIEITETNSWLDDPEIISAKPDTYLSVFYGKDTELIKNGVSVGNLILTQGNEITEITDYPVEIRFLDVTKIYVEDVKFDPNNLPNTFQTTKQIQDAGLSIDQCREEYRCELLIKWTSSDPEKLPSGKNGKEEDWTKAIYTFRKSAIASFKSANGVIQARKREAEKLGKDFYSVDVAFMLTLEEKRNGAITYWVPILKYVPQDMTKKLT